MKPEEASRLRIDQQLKKAGWNVIDRLDFTRFSEPVAVKEFLLEGNLECDYLLFIDGKAIAVIEAKSEINPLGEDVANQAENYAHKTLDWTQKWYSNYIPLVYLSNGKQIKFRNLHDKTSEEYNIINEFHTPKEMLSILKLESTFGALPYFEQGGLRDCQYKAELELERTLREGKKRALSILATGSGKTYFACLASYRMLKYTPIKRILFLVDRNNLAQQTLNEFSAFSLTENSEYFSQLYPVSLLSSRLDDMNSTVVISTIQRLFSVLTGTNIENEKDSFDEEVVFDSTPVNLGQDLLLSPNHFQFIIIDECHRSIYGKWKTVLNYFNEAIILGLTATPTEEAFTFFGQNVIENYSYDQSVIDGVNVASRVYEISTQTTTHGNQIEKGNVYEEVSNYTGESSFYLSDTHFDYCSTQLDRSVVDTNQIKLVIQTYKEKIYTDLFPNREKTWEYIPKTLIFAKNENHATNILNTVNNVFGECFPNQKVPNHFVQKITYTSDRVEDLIREFRTEKAFRIAITVTLVATGTDVRPLEVVLFMNDVKSDVLYTQMKGRGCRYIGDDKLKEVTPNADTKDCYYIVDAVGVTKEDRTIKGTKEGNNVKRLSLRNLIEHLSHGEYTDENLINLRDSLSSIHSRYENNSMLKYHLDEYIENYGFSPRELANSINQAICASSFPVFNPNVQNLERHQLISKLIDNHSAKDELLELQKGYRIINQGTPDTLIYAGFTQDDAMELINTFEKYIEEQKNHNEVINKIDLGEWLFEYDQLKSIRDILIQTDARFSAYQLWKSYSIINSDRVDKLNMCYNANSLTNLLQIIRFALKKTNKLISLYSQYEQRFSLFCGTGHRTLTQEEKVIMHSIGDYIVEQGAISLQLLNRIDSNLWRQGQRVFNNSFEQEVKTLTKYILKVVA